MSEMIERVAEAIYNAGATSRGISTPWSDAVERSERRGYVWAKAIVTQSRREAVEAIKALRDPTPQMLVAGCHASNETMDETWRAMIDAALNSTVQITQNTSTINTVEGDS